MPATAAHYAVTQDGRWTRHIGDTVTAVDRPGGQQLSLIDGEDAVAAGSAEPAPPGDLARSLLGFLARTAGPPPDADPAPHRHPDPTSGATPAASRPDTGMAPEELRALAARYGLSAGQDGDILLIGADAATSGRHALRQERPGGPLLNYPGRVIPPHRAGAYLAAYAASPRTHPDGLYTEVIYGGWRPGGERAWPRESYHHARDEAARRARETSRDHHLYADGRAAVAAAQPPDEAAYYSVTPAGQWTRHMNGAADRLEHAPAVTGLSVIAGETAAAAGQAALPPAPAGWTATHPFAAQITAMRAAAVADTAVAATAGSGDAQNFRIAFTAWARDYLAATASAALTDSLAATAGPPAWARAFLDDHAFTADLTATLAAQTVQQVTGEPAAIPPEPDARAVAMAAMTWLQRAEKARSAESGCPPACDTCTFPAEANPGLRQATAIDMHLARAGILHTLRGITWDADAGTWAATITGDHGEWRLLIDREEDSARARPDGPYRITRDGLDAGTAPPGSPGEAAAGFRQLIIQRTGHDPASAGQPPPEPAATPAPAGDLRDLADRHGLAVTSGRDGEETISRAETPASIPARPALSRYGGLLINGNGRTIPPGRADDYLAAYAAAPRTDPDLLYARVIAGHPDATDADLTERAYPWHLYHHARDDAASRARDNHATWYVYCDGRAYVTAAGPLAQAAYCSVTADGHWALHRDSTTEPLPGRPSAHDFSALASQAPPAAAGEDTPDAGRADDRMAAYQDLAARHGLRAEPGEYAGEILIRSPHSAPGRFALSHDRPGAPALNENGRVIPVPRLDRYLAAYAAAPDTDPGHLYAQAAAGSPDAAADERAFPLRRGHEAAGDASSRARRAGTAHHLYRDGEAIVSTPREPSSPPYYTVTPGGLWTGTPDTRPLFRQQAPAAEHLRSLTSIPGPAGASPPAGLDVGQEPRHRPSPAPGASPPGAPNPAIRDSGAATALPRVTVLHGHISPDTAFEVDGYPYGRLTCKRRSWLETATKGSARGQVRLVHQTTNPKRSGEFWNNPKPSTYVHWAVMYLKPNGHLDWHACGYWGPGGALDARIHLDGTYDQFTDAERAAYDVFAARSRANGGWENWDKALAFIRGHIAEHGRPPTLDQVASGPGFYLPEPDREIALIAAQAPPATDPESAAGDTSPGPPAEAGAARAPAVPDSAEQPGPPTGGADTVASPGPGESAAVAQPPAGDAGDVGGAPDPGSRQPRPRPPRRPQPPRVVRNASDLRQLASTYSLSTDTGPAGSGRAPLTEVHDRGRTVLLHDEISGTKAGGYRLDPGEVDAYLAAYTDHPGLPPRPLLDLARRDPATPDDLTLTGAREIAARHRLEVRIRRIAGQSYITVCQPGVTGPPVLSYPAGTGTGYHGPCAVPGPAADSYLLAYRDNVPTALFTAPADAPPDWARRVAQLSPHLVEEGGHFIAGVRDHLRAALAAARDGNHADAAREFDLAEGLTPPLSLPPDREAELAAVIGERAHRYGHTEDPASYLASAGQADVSAREWDWVRSYIAEHPDVREGPAQDATPAPAAQPDADRQAAEDKSRQALAAFANGDYEQALTLLDEAELLSPGQEVHWAAARQQVIDATSGLHDSDPDAEPYASPAEGHAAYRQVIDGYEEMSRTPAGERILGYSSTPRPDATALKAAHQALPRWYMLKAHCYDPAAAAPKFAAAAEAAQSLLDNLTRERVRAPKFTERLEAFAQRARLAAARAAATAARGYTAPPAPSQPAPAQAAETPAGNTPGPGEHADPAQPPAGQPEDARRQVAGEDGTPPAPAGAAGQGPGTDDQRDSAMAPIWSATRDAAQLAAEQGRTWYVYRAAADGDPLRCVITSVPPRAAAGYLSVTAAGDWTETWRGQEQPLQAGPHELLEPDYPITLSEARELARACRLEVHVSRAAGRTFVSLSEPGTTITHQTTGEVSPATPVVCFEYGTRDVFAGRRSTAPGRAIVWLSIYRETVDEWSARHRGDIFAVTNGVRNWQRRLACLVPHLPTGPDHERAVAENLDSAIRCCRRGDDGAAEQQLRRAEDASPGLVLAPAREAAITDKIASDAPGYAWTGSPARYIAEIMDATRPEWDWIDRRVSADPAVFSGDRAAQQPSARESAQQKEAAYQERKAAAQDLARQAKSAYDAGRYGEALALIDDAEILDPGLGRRCHQIREEIAAAARRIADGSAADPRPPEEPGTPDTTPGTVAGQDDAQPPAQAAPGTAPTTPLLADAASGPGSADGDEASAGSDSQPGSAGTREAAAAATDTTSDGQPEWMGQVAAAQVVADRLYLDGYVPADGEHDALEAGLAAARQHLGADAVETTSLISAHRKSSRRRAGSRPGRRHGSPTRSAPPA